jgi:hypothetical protein
MNRLVQQISPLLMLWIALFMSPDTAHCRIGETLDQCKARYGDPISVLERTALFSNSGIFVSTHFDKGQVDEISYYRTSVKNSKRHVCPSDAEVHVLLNANAQDSKWELQGSYWHHALWVNREHGLSAFRTERALTISISDPAVFQTYHERKAAARTLEGF